MYIGPNLLHLCRPDCFTVNGALEKTATTVTYLTTTLHTSNNKRGLEATHVRVFRLFFFHKQGL